MTAQSKKWCLTLHIDEPAHDSDTQWDPSDAPRLTNGQLPRGVAYCVWQYERAPSTGKLHIQGYARFDARVRMNGVKQAFGQPTMHCVPAKGSEEENRNYCTKADTRVLAGEELGDYDAKNNQGQRKDLDAIAARIKEGAGVRDIAAEMPQAYIRFHAGINALHVAMQGPPGPRDLTTYYLWGPTGTGKTHRVRTALPDIYCVIPGRDPWGGYHGQTAILFDEWNPESWTIQQMNLFLDRWDLLLDRRYQNVYARWSTVYICTNINPTAAYADEPNIMLLDSFRRRITGSCRLVTQKENEGGPTLAEIHNIAPNPF